MKKQLIFKEVLAMLNSGTEYKAITLAEVAKRCKMGKSTIYEYFTSKDEMIYSAIIFYINKMLKFFSSSFKISTFEPSLKIWIKAMMVCMKSNKWMLLPWTFKTYASYLREEDAARAEDLLGKSQTIIIKLLTAICKKGVAEGYLVEASEESVEYSYYGAIGTLAKYVGEDFDYTSEEGTWLAETITAQIIKHMSTDEAYVERPDDDTDAEEDVEADETDDAEEQEADETEETDEEAEESEEEPEEDTEYEDGDGEEYEDADGEPQEEYEDGDAEYDENADEYDESGDEGEYEEADDADAQPEYEEGPEDIDY